MKLIKGFKKFFDNRKIDSICKEYDITDYTINSDGSIDVDCSVYIRFKRLTKLPLKFGRVSGDFDCSHNNLTSLEGCPGWVGRNFDCHNNNLTSLKGSPSSIEDDFVCHNNKLTTLEGGPRVVNGNFDCSSNQLTNLIGGPGWVGRNIMLVITKLHHLKDFQMNILMIVILAEIQFMKF